MTDVTPRTPQEIWQNLQINGFLFESFADSLIATAGGGQSTALQLNAEVNRITTVVTTNDSVALPPAIAGLTIMVINHGANAMQVFGNLAAGDVINDQATATGVSQMVNSVVIYVCTVNGKWYANGLGTGYAGSFETTSYQTGLTAHAGGGQPSAFPITTMLAQFTTVATAGDSAVLPVGITGMQITVVNTTATSMNVFPATGGTINALAANTALAVTNAAPTIFYCTGPNAWWTK